ncbi:hypothetical protein C8R43DRAFT_1016970 [Mycena crocata]|nr:hypothetical protein C8R43DRAFT_1016970 [Mycena crocata]
MAAIDSDIEWHYAQIAVLKAKRNSFAPICGLPNELLSRIITIYVVESEFLFNLKWVKTIPHVCRHWHDLALAAQSLWSFIDFGWGHAGWEKLYQQLQRSGAAPLTLKISHCDSAHYIRNILENSERMHTLELAGDARHIHDLLVKLPDASFPLLSSLMLDANRKREGLVEGVFPTLADSLLRGGLPSLRGLKLTSVNLPWKSIQGLTSLSLNRCNDSASPPQQTLHDLVDMLRLCPRLETLNLEYVIPALEVNRSDTVYLPVLTSVLLRTNADRCTAFLHRVRFPPSTRMQVYPSDVNIGADIREMLVPICQRLRAPASPTPALVSIECYSGSEHRVSNVLMGAYTATAPPALMTGRDAAHLILNSHPTNGASLRQIMSKMVKAMLFKHITHLDARLAIHLTAKSWRAALKLLPAVETVYIQSHDGVCNFLRALIESAAPGESEAVYRPLLRCLHILAAVWEDGDETIPTMLALVKTYMELRHANDAPLPVLEIEERHACLSAYEEQLKGLFPLVGEEMIRDGKVYDPIKEAEELAQHRAAWRARAARLGIDLGEESE